MTNSIPMHKKLLLLGCALLLGACQALTPGDKGLAVKRDAWEHLKPGCQGDSCPLVNIDVISFPDHPQLSELVTQRLLRMTADAPDAPLPASLQSYEKDFLQRAEPGWASYLQAKVREQRDQLTIIELSSYLATGGAHGMPGRGLINYDRTQDKVLTLRDMLIPGQEAEFWKLAEQATSAGWPPTSWTRTRNTRAPGPSSAPSTSPSAARCCLSMTSTASRPTLAATPS